MNPYNTYNSFTTPFAQNRISCPSSSVLYNSKHIEPGYMASEHISQILFLGVTFWCQYETCHDMV